MLARLLRHFTVSQSPHSRNHPHRARRARLTWLSTQVGVKALRLEHDEQRAPAQEDCREEEVFQHRGAGHPPAAPMSSGQGGRHDAARWPGSGSAATCAQTWGSARGPAQSVPPSSAAVAARSLSALRGPDSRCAQRRKPQPCPGPGPPTAADLYGCPRRRENRSGQAGRPRLCLLRGKLRYASRKGLTPA